MSLLLILHMNNRTMIEKKEIKKSLLRETVEMILYIFFVLILSIIIVTYIGQRTQVIGSSMENTLEQNDNLILDKISYRFNDPKRFDIIVFPYSDGTRFIKRIIGLPGETVQILDGVIYINDEVLTENYGLEKTEYSGIASDKIVLGDDEYFVLGDNRKVSLDSRYEEVGNIKRNMILGKAWIRIWPLNKFGVIKHQ